MQIKPMHSITVALLGVLLFAFAVAGPGAAFAQSAASLHLVVVFDGLRPDSINATDMPNLFRLRTEGVAFENSHSVFPTVTRVNATSLGTGAYPARHGILGNTIYVPAVDPQRAFSNESVQMLLRLDEASGGRMVTARGIAEILEQAGRKMIAVGTGTRGGNLLLAPKAPLGAGAIINANFVGGARVAYPDAVNTAVLERFGPPPKGEANDWAMRVLHEYVLQQARPAIVFLWFNEPDHAQHTLGVGAPKAVATIRQHDARLGLVLAQLQASGFRDKANVIVLSDHGFAQTVYAVNVTEQLVAAELMSAGSQEVILASSGQEVAVHVENRDPRRIRAIAEFLQHQPWCGLVFTVARRGGAAHEGAVPGTFALEYVHLGGHERSPDIVFTFPWSSASNPHGVPGTDYTYMNPRGRTGPVTGARASHGGLSPWTIRNTMIASGPDFKRGAVITTPVSNVDIAPTLLHLLGLGDAAKDMDGRVMVEALAGGPDAGQIVSTTRVLRMKNGDYGAALQITELGSNRYIDKGWREP
jgi:predicted AlkP superfamily pyrophosphatase or phosphodiesterase